ncbi:MAG TPA: PGPGW domain-containing protein [Actinomycetota bacterium]|nr:PGPGW domain-containing protein [Actinomycetota bacterium]
MSKGPGQEQPPAIVRRLQSKRAAYRRRGRLYRAVWVAAGATVLAAGLAMTVLPGPAVVVIPLGLAMLSFEFTWAQKLMDKALAQSAAAKEKAERSRPRTKIFGVFALMCAAAAAAYVGYVWLV